MTTNPLSVLFRKSLSTDLSSSIASTGLLLLRGVTGILIFYIHGWHKLVGGIAWIRQGTPWPLMEDIVGMHLPMPAASAFAATIVQFLCAPMVALGLFTRVNAALLTGTLSVAILQNLLAARDPQVAFLYTLNVAAITLLGGGRFSLDAMLFRRVALE